jgi:protein SCO1/2
MRLCRHASAERLCLSGRRHFDFTRGVASRSRHSLSQDFHGKSAGRAKPFRTSGGRAAFFYLLLLLLTAHCSLLTALAQPGAPQPNSPLYGAAPATGQVSTGLPKVLKSVGIDQRLNEQIPLDAVFKDERGQDVRLGQYFNGKPVVLSLVYYSCPMLCNQVLNGMMGSLRQVSFNIGEQFEVVTVSFDPRETPELAAAKKSTYIKAYNRPGAEASWHFLTGDEANIKRLTEAVGFRYVWDEQTKQFAHASGIMLLTPEGKLARYFYGIEYPPRDLRLGLVEASQNKIGTPVDALMLYCYHYDPATGKYGAIVMNIVRLAGGVTLFLIVGMILVLRKRSGRSAVEV